MSGSSPVSGRAEQHTYSDQSMAPVLSEIQQQTTRVIADSTFGKPISKAPPNPIQLNHEVKAAVDIPKDSPAYRSLGKITKFVLWLFSCISSVNRYYKARVEEHEKYLSAKVKDRMDKLPKLDTSRAAYIADPKNASKLLTIDNQLLTSDKDFSEKHKHKITAKVATELEMYKKAPSGDTGVGSLVPIDLMKQENL